MNADLSPAAAKIAYESRKRRCERQQQQQQYQTSNNGTLNEQMDTINVAEPLNQKLAIQHKLQQPI